ncbi:hypothetical protein [Clostridium cylindrosporum]|uniref:Uncharacterized protein n=1 Tax=Clostridium cylindrosporum DSM 605 TaxID=1121307 RepID=A0A0J8DA29_CLOCY|nr:hypothetical protein [Clostridium cylindrosporum]KMT22910.1 hypothetical protein CLCY_5c01490 [Clostridium cylindrosporum DSM 605]
MSKINSAEKFYIEKISEGFEMINREFTHEKLLILLSSSLKEDGSIHREIKRALDAIYIKETKGDEAQPIKDKYKSHALKLYKGRETLLRDTVIEWYSSSSMPSIIDSIRGIFR